MEAFRVLSLVVKFVQFTLILRKIEIHPNHISLTLRESN